MSAGFLSVANGSEALATQRRAFAISTGGFSSPAAWTTKAQPAAHGAIRRQLDAQADHSAAES